MPVKPTFDWEQSDTQIILRAQIKGFKADAVDVFISDNFVKINAHPTYLLQLDLLHPITVDKSGFWCDMPTVKITLHKSLAQPWDTLCIDPKTPLNVLRERREEALVRAEALYNTTLRSREEQKAVEKKRMFNEHWEIEKSLRREIEEKIKRERETEATDLAQWEESVEKQPRKSFVTPGDITLATPGVRGAGGETKNITIDFTPANLTAPSRSRGDEDYYLKSRYKPVSIEDAPMFWKEKGDKLYKARDWLAASSAYSESIKRDGAFLTCVMNRAACHLHMHEYDKCIADCELAMNILANTPASETTQDRYKAILVKLHVRRGAARAWAGDAAKALEDFRMAQAYRRACDDDQVGETAEIDRDLGAVEGYMQRKGLVEVHDPIAALRYKANHAYHSGQYLQASDGYREVLESNAFDYKARINLSAALLQMGQFKESLDETNKVIEFCKEVAQALLEPGVQSSNLVDSDDEEEAEDDLVAKRTEAAKTIRDRSNHVYVLLKCYVRAAAAYCGMGSYREGYEMMELAVRISPYDDDLRDDANRILDKLRMETLVKSTKSGQLGAGVTNPAASNATPVEL